MQAIKDYEFTTPYAVFANRNFGQMEHIDDCVWTEKDRKVRSMSSSNGISVVPRDIKKYLKTQIYDYLQIDIRRQRLLYGGFTLLDECTLAMYQIKENCVIHLLYQLY